jgi:hypothetical protein
LKIQFEEEKNLYQMNIQASIESMEKNNLNLKSELKYAADKITDFGRF